MIDFSFPHRGQCRQYQLSFAFQAIEPRKSTCEERVHRSVCVAMQTENGGLVARELIERQKRSLMSPSLNHSVSSGLIDAIIDAL